MKINLDYTNSNCETARDTSTTSFASVKDQYYLMAENKKISISN